MPDKPPIDPEFAPLLEAMAALPPMSEWTLEQIRTPPDASAFGAPEDVAEVRDLSIPADHGGIPARLYVPEGKPTALIVYYHGGGWMLGGIDTHDVPLRAFANRTGAAVLSIDYRLTPEHVFPAPLDDCYAALVWADEHQEELAGGRVPILIGGDSAGGNLTATTALLAQQRGGPALAGQILLYPSLDSRCEGASWEEHADCPMLTAANMRFFWNTYLPDAAQRRNPLASPRDAASHAGLPPAIIAVAEYDPLRDEGLAYADRLRAAGTEATLLVYETLPHGFFNFLNLSKTAGAAFDEIADRTRDLIAKSQVPA